MTDGAISLYSPNPRYFLFRGKPTLLVTSGEHYGAVLNGGFDYVKYLETLGAEGLNHTRTFSGVYREVQGVFGIRANTLAPRNLEDYVSPWVRTDIPGAADGGNKFDLDAWNEAYFKRLDSFMAEASRHGVVVELTLFCPFYAKPNGDLLWNQTPMNPRNNINALSDVSPYEFHTLKNPDTTERQLQLVKEIVARINSYDNLIYEIVNEPWNDGVTLEWQALIAKAIGDAEASLPLKHLISRNICNGYQRIAKADEGISVYQFHYASPPEAARINQPLGLPMGLNETGFAGIDDYTYRYQAWEFLFAGGALFNNLDYSFAVGYEDGSLAVTDGVPGGGSHQLRRQLAYLKRLCERIEAWRLTPDKSFIAGIGAAHVSAESLCLPDRLYAIYIRGSFEVFLQLELSAGIWRIEWVSPEACETVKADELTHGGGIAEFYTEGHGRDVAIIVERVDSRDRQKML